MRRLLAAVTTLALTTALALAAPLAAHADGVPFPPLTPFHNIVGSLDSVSFVPGEGLVAVGWAFDRTNPTASVNGLEFQVQRPDGSTGWEFGAQSTVARPDVAAAHPEAGPNHGFRAAIGFSRPGSYTYCGEAEFEVFGCVYAYMPPNALSGQLESLTLDTSGVPSLRLQGWSADSYLRSGSFSTDPGRITYTIEYPSGGASGTSGSGDADRPDIRASHPSLTGVAGFDDLIPISAAGQYRACASIFPKFSAGGAGETVIGCLDLTVPGVTGGPVTLSGDPVLGGTVTASTPTWTPTPASDQFSWTRVNYESGSVGVGTSGSRSYSPVLADVGHILLFNEDVTAPGVLPTSVVAQTKPVKLPGVKTTRIGGADRYEMAVANAQSQFPDSAAGAPVVYVASGEKFPDALAAGPAAAKEHGALLLTFADHLPDSVRAEITRLHPASIVVAGGPATVSDAVLADLNTLAPAERVDGVDRYAVSRALIARAFPQGAPSVYLVTGANYADALSAGAAAASVGAPVLLADGGAPTADQATLATLAAADTTSVTVVGGTASVSPGVAGSLGAGIAVNRLAGPDRYTGTVVLNRASFQTAGTVYLATGLNFPDGLTGGVHAGADHAPLYLVNGSCVPQDVLADILSLHASKVVLLGGPATLSQTVQDLYACS